MDQPLGTAYHTKTVGNFSFIRFHVKVAGDQIKVDQEERILAVLQDFEQVNGLEIVHWYVQKHPTNPNVYDGVWIQHKPKTVTGVPPLRQNVGSPPDIGCDFS